MPADLILHTHYIRIKFLAAPFIAPQLWHSRLFVALLSLIYLENIQNGFVVLHFRQFTVIEEKGSFLLIRDSFAGIIFS